MSHTVGMLEISDMIPLWAVGFPASMANWITAIPFGAMHRPACSCVLRGANRHGKTIASHFVYHRHLIFVRSLTLWTAFRVKLLHQEFALTASAIA